jgi:hypothetical protein
MHGGATEGSGREEESCERYKRSRVLHVSVFVHCRTPFGACSGCAPGAFPFSKGERTVGSPPASPRGRQ